MGAWLVSTISSSGSRAWYGADEKHRKILGLLVRVLNVAVLLEAIFNQMFMLCSVRFSQG